MKRKIFVIAAVALFSVAMLSSCKSNKPGIVPCPQHHISVSILK